MTIKISNLQASLPDGRFTLETEDDERIGRGCFPILSYEIENTAWRVEFTGAEITDVYPVPEELYSTHYKIKLGAPIEAHVWVMAN